MDKKVSFRWVSLIRDSKDHANGHFNDEFTIVSTYTGVSIKQMAEVVKKVKTLGGLVLPPKGEYCTVAIQDLTTPIQLLSYIEIRSTTSTVCVVDKGPSLQWLLDHEEELTGTSPDSVLYTDTAAIKSMTYTSVNENTVVITILDVSNIGNVIDELGDKYVDWLDGTFKEFLACYGYTGKDTVKEASQALMTYQTAVEAGFKDPKEVAATLNNKRIIADLIIREVFEGIGKY